MAKSNPIGVRFDLDLLEKLKEDKLADSPQRVLNYLTEFYRHNREKPDYKKIFEDSGIFQNLNKQTGDVELKPPDTTNVGIKTKKNKNESDPYSGLSKGEILRKMRENKL